MDFLFKVSNGNQMEIVGQITTIEDTGKIFFLRGELARLKAQMKRMEEELDKEIMDYFDREKVDAVEQGDERIYRAKKKKNRYDSEAIFKALEFTTEQRLVLPTNPSWKKTEVLSNEKTAIAFYEEEEDVIEVKTINKKFIKAA
jgi:hypothetical protein